MILAELVVQQYAIPNNCGVYRTPTICVMRNFTLMILYFLTCVSLTVA